LRRCSNGGLDKNHLTKKKIFFAGDIDTDTEAYAEVDTNTNTYSDTNSNANADDATWQIHPGNLSNEAIVNRVRNSLNLFTETTETNITRVEVIEKSESISVVFGDMHTDMKSLADATFEKNLQEEQRVIVRPGQASSQIEQFLQSNSACVECGSTDRIMWISVNIGVTLCQDCSNIHTRLGWALSKLRNVTLDDFSDWQCEILLKELGNEKSLKILEASIPEGWIKPTPNSSFDDKAQWIYAKYRWRAFISDGHMNSDSSSNGIRDTECLNFGIIDAARTGNGERLMWWLAHRADVNVLYKNKDSDYPRTPIQEAILKGHMRCISLLALNGADIYLRDGNGATAFNYLENGDNVLDPNTVIGIQTVLLNTLRADC